MLAPSPDGGCCAIRAHPIRDAVDSHLGTGTATAAPMAERRPALSHPRSQRRTGRQWTPTWSPVWSSALRHSLRRPERAGTVPASPASGGRFRERDWVVGRLASGALGGRLRGLAAAGLSPVATGDVDDDHRLSTGGRRRPGTASPEKPPRAILVAPVPSDGAGRRPTLADRRRSPGPRRLETSDSAWTPASSAIVLAASKAVRARFRCSLTLPHIDQPPRRSDTCAATAATAPSRPAAWRGRSPARGPPRIPWTRQVRRRCCHGSSFRSPTRTFRPNRAYLQQPVIRSSHDG